MLVTLLSLTLMLVTISDANHFRGGIITWEPASTVTSGDTNITIIVRQRYAWTRSLVPCTQAAISSQTLIGDYVVNPIECLSNVTQCSSSGYNAQQLSSDVHCTDINLSYDISSGERTQFLSLPNGTKLLLAFVSIDAWVILRYFSPAGDGWSLPVLIDLTPRPVIGINHSPTSNMPVMVNVPTGVWTLIEVPMSDVDSTDVVKCRWSQSNGTLNGIKVDECAGACRQLALPSTVQLRTFGVNRCQLNVSLVSTGYYIAALQIEDFASNASTVALSSVPLQVVLNGFYYFFPTTSCTKPPNVTNILPFSLANGGNVSVTMGIRVSGVVLARTGCINDTITNIDSFLTSSPPGMTKSNSVYAWTPAPLYATNFTWTPTVDQVGLTFQLCAVAIDVNDYSSESYCVNFLVVAQPTSTTSTSTTTSSTSSTSSSTATSTTTSTTSTTTTSRTTSTTSTTTTSTTSATTTSTVTSATSTTTSTTATTATSTTTTTTRTVTSSTTASTTSTSVSTVVPVPVATVTVTVTVIRAVPSTDTGLLLGLGLGLGLPLLLLLCSLALCGCCRSKLGSFRSKKLTDNSLKRVPSPKLKSSNQQTRALDDPRPDYREQYINKNPDPSEKSPSNENNRASPHDSFASEQLSTFDFNDLNATTTSFFSASNNGLPTDRVDASGVSESFTNSWQNGSILVRAYSKQHKQNPM